MSLFQREKILLMFYIGVALNAWMLHLLSSKLTVLIDGECAFYNYRMMRLNNPENAVFEKF